MHSRRRVIMGWWGIVLGLALVAGPVESAPAGEEKPPEKINYADHVRPIFRQHCFACHNQNKKQNDLAVDLYESLMEGGASGEVVTPGDLDDSYLWSLISHEDEPAMPPNQDRIPDDQLEVVRLWIVGGALKDAGSKAVLPKKPAVDLAVSVGAVRPDGPPVMPEGLRRQPLVHTDRPGAVTAIAAGPWAPVVAVGGQQQVALYNTESGQYLGVLPFPEGIPQVLKFSRSGALLLAGGGKGAYQGLAVVYDVKTGDRVFEVGDELDAVLAADINADHSLIALGGPQKVVRVYSTADGSLAYEITKHTDWVYAVEFSPDGVLLATADRGGGLRVWEAHTGREFHNLDGKHKGAVTDVAWRADSNVLASASEDGTIKLWEMENGNQVRSINAHGGGVAAVEFAHDGRMVSCGRDRVAKVWDTSGGQLRAFEAFADLALDVAFAHDGRRVVAGDWTGLVRIWEVEKGARVAELSSNPPTLDMILAQLESDAAPKRAAAEKAASELAAAKKDFAAKEEQAKEAEKTAAQVADAAKQAADKAAEAQATAAETTQTTENASKEAQAAVAAAQKLKAEALEAEKTATQMADAAKQAADQADAAQATAAETAQTAENASKEAQAVAAAAQELKTEAGEARKTVIQKAVAAKITEDAAEAAEAAITEVQAEKAALQQSAPTDR